MWVNWPLRDTAAQTALEGRIAAELQPEGGAGAGEPGRSRTAGMGTADRRHRQGRLLAQAENLSGGRACGYLLASPPQARRSTPWDLVCYILGYGVLGIVALALVFRILVPAKALDKERGNAQADLIEENRRLLARAEKAEDQCDDALKIAQEQIAPLLTNFNATVSALLPLLQELVTARDIRAREGREREPRRRP